MRINGFSGMDIDSMVKSLMTVQRMPLDKLNQEKQTLQWTRDNYREFNSQFVAFKNKLSDFGKQATTNTQVSTVTGNTAAVRAVANATASSEPMEVSVTKLATKSSAASTAGLVVSSSSTTAATPKTTLAQLTGAADSASYTMNVNGKDVAVLGSDSLDVVVAKINSSGAGVNASFDEISGKFLMTAKEYGTANDIKIIAGATGSDLSEVLKLSVANSTSGEAVIKNAANPTGRTFTTSNNSININGIELTLQQVTKIGNVDTPATVTTQADPTKAVDTIKSFVELYNGLVDKINTKTTEARYKNFTPLTDEQKKEMKESEITQWEEKAKSGLLKGDGILKSAASNMRTTVVGYLGDLSSVGITTGLYHENGKLKIDEAKLKDALTTDPQKVLSIFQGSSSDISKNGLFADLSKQVNGTLDQMVSKVGTSKFDTSTNSIFKEESMMGRQLKDYNKRISSMTTRINDMETRYYKQFTAMETAMSKMQSQSSNLASYLG